MITLWGGGGAVPCTLGWSAANLASTHQMPTPPTLTSYDNQKYLWASPEVPRPQTQLRLRTIRTEADVSGGSVGRNPSANAGHTGSIPVQKGPLCTEQLSPSEPVLWSPHTTTAGPRAPLEPVKEKATSVKSRCTATSKEPPLSTTRKSPHSSEDPVQPERNLF